MWHDKIQISRKCGKPVSKTHQDKHCQSGARSGVIPIDTQIFSLRPTHPAVGQKTSLVNFKHKLTTLAKYTDGQALVQDIEEGCRQKAMQNVVVLDWGARSNAALRILV